MRRRRLARRFVRRSCLERSPAFQTDAAELYNHVIECELKDQFVSAGQKRGTTTSTVDAFLSIVVVVVVVVVLAFLAGVAVRAAVQACVRDKVSILRMKEGRL